MPTRPPESGDGSPVRRIRRLWIVLGVLLGLAIGFRIALPYAIQWGVGWGAMRQIGHVAHLENIDLSFFAGTVLIENLVVAQGDMPPAEGQLPDPDGALLVLERAFVDVSWLDLFKGMLHFTEVDLNGPRIVVERLADGRIDPLGQGPGPPGRKEAQAAAAADAPAESQPAAEELSEEEGVQPQAEGGGWPIVLDLLDLDGTFLHVRDKVDGAELAAVDIGELQVSDLRLASDSFGLGGVALTRPMIRVQREFALDPTGGREPSEAAEPAVEEAEPAQPSQPRERRSTRLEDLDIQRAAFNLLVGDRELAVALRLKAEQVTLDPGETFHLALGVDIEDGTIQIDGEAGALPPFFDGTIKISQLPLPLIPLIALPDAADWFKSSRIGADMNVLARPVVVEGSSEAPGVHVDGTFQIASLDLSNPGGGDEVHFKWDSLDLELKSIDLPLGDAALTTPVSVDLGTVALTKPQILYTRPSPALQALLSPPAPEESAEAEPVEAEAEGEPAPAGPPPEIRVARFELREGAVRFNDNAVQPTYRGIVDRLEVTADAVDPGAPSIGHLVVDARLPGGSRLDVDGKIGATDGEVRLDVKRLTLPPMNPYAANAGVKLDKGGLSLGADIEAHGTHWTVDSDVTLHDLAFDRAASKEFVDKLGMPLDLILSVLRSPNGDISVPVDVEFDEGGSAVDTTEIIMGALRQALVGAATIPLKALGGVFGAVGGGGVSFEPLLAVPGSTDPAPGIRERVDGLLELLASRPGLLVRLTGTTGDEDVPFLAEEELADRVAAGGDLPELRDDQQAGLFARGRIKGALKKRAKGEPIDLKEEDMVFLRRYVATVSVPEARHAALANARAERTRKYLLATQAVEETRISIDPPGRGQPGVEFAFGSVD